MTPDNSQPSSPSSPPSTLNSKLSTGTHQRAAGNCQLATAVIALVAYTALLAYASLKPISPEAADAISGTRRAVNNLLHVPAYAVLAALWTLLLRSAARSARRLRSILLGGLIAVLFGAVMEAVQGLVVPGRMAGWEDFGLNTSGAALAGVVMTIWHRRTREPTTDN
jgi:VanZ family protein